MKHTGMRVEKTTFSLQSLLARSYPELDKKEIYALILCGEVMVNSEVRRQPNANVCHDARLKILKKTYVSRGGVKLRAALDDFGVSPKNLVCLDAGASTGGFTDCLLQMGAEFVHSVDVGFNQLAWKLRIDDRVSVHERTNLMKIGISDLNPRPQLATADLSFRSLRGASSHLLALVGDGSVIALVKPQFERPAQDDFKGVVNSDEVRKGVINRLRIDLLKENVYIVDFSSSVITGRKGNVEIFIKISRKSSPFPDYVEERFQKVFSNALP